MPTRPDLIDWSERPFTVYVDRGPDGAINCLHCNGIVGREELTTPVVDQGTEYQVHIFDDYDTARNAMVFFETCLAASGQRTILQLDELDGQENGSYTQIGDGNGAPEDVETGDGYIYAVFLSTFRKASASGRITFHDWRVNPYVMRHRQTLALAASAMWPEDYGELPPAEYWHDAFGGEQPPTHDLVAIGSDKRELDAVASELCPPDLADGRWKQLVAGGGGAK